MNSSLLPMELADCYRHCPRCGRAPLSRKDDGGFVCNACGMVRYLNPSTAVAGFLIDPAGRTLLIRRASDPGKGRLAPPGGFVDAGESAEDALRREILEEVGLSVGNLRYIASFPNRYIFKGTAIPVVDLFFSAEVQSFEGAAALDDVHAVEILSLDELDPEQLAFPSIQKAYACLRRMKN